MVAFERAAGNERRIFLCKIGEFATLLILRLD